MRALIILTLSLFVSTLGFGQINKWTSGPSTQVTTSAIRPTQPVGMNLEVRRGIVTLGIKDQFSSVIPSPTNVEVQVSIVQENIANIPLTQTISTTLDVSYNDDNDAAAHQREESYVFAFDPSLHELKATITQVKVNGNILPVTLFPQYAFIEVSILQEGYRELSTTPSTMFTGANPEDYLVDTDCDGIMDQLEVTWEDVQGAQEYQLEWVYVNDYHPTTIGSDLPVQNILFDFRRNSTRISTYSTSYKLNLVFDKGYLLFRVRAVGVDHLNPNNIEFGPWSTVESGNLNNLQPHDYYQILFDDRHQKDLNWQYSATYAEEGKRKEVVTYFDGSLRNRQMVTNISTDNNAIVGETIYDFEGRPVVNVLPTPAYVNACQSSVPSPTLKYYENFNRAQGAAYNYTHFDYDASCVGNSQPMDQNIGASQYYSQNNPDKNFEQGYVPNADGFPFTQVKYTSDNTGRVREQSGVGAELGVNGDNTTKYYYGKPNQVELNRMYGSEVGDDGHYQKNMVIDPNGQVSISYMDQEERVIATALAGAAPENLETLNSTQPPVPITVDAIGSNKSIEDGFEIRETILFTNPSNFVLNYNFAVPGFVDSCIADVCFNCVYELEFELLDECGVNVLIDIRDSLDVVDVRDLRVRNPITGENIVVPTGGVDDQIIGQLHTDSLGNLLFANTGCSSPTQSTASINGFAVLIPKAGSYTLLKRIKIFEPARVQYLELLTDSTRNVCFKTLSDFQNEELSEIDSTLCDQTCESCLEDLGTLSDYVNSGRGTQEDYNEQYEDCQMLCVDDDENMSYTLAYATMMESHVSPGGQYAMFDFDNGFDASSYPLSIYNSDNELPAFNQGASVPGSQNREQWRFPMHVDDDGDMQIGYFDASGQRSRIPVQTVNSTTIPAHNGNVQTDPVTGEQFIYPEQLQEVSDFVNVYWKASWARSLIVFHPEFVYLQKYYGMNQYYSSADMSSTLFDNIMIQAETFNDAVNAGLFDQTYLNQTSSQKIAHWFTQQPNGSSLVWDPFVAQSSQFIENNVDYGSQLLNEVTSYEIGGQQYHIVDVASSMARCPSNPDPNDPSCVGFGTGADQEIINKEWSILKGLYTSLKNTYVMRSAHAKAVHKTAGADFGGYNRCIGEQTFNAFAPPMIETTNTQPYSNYYPNQQANNTCQPCSKQTYDLYIEKVRVFADFDQQGQVNVDEGLYHHYATSGQCPQTMGVQNVLSELANTASLLNPAGTNLQPLHSFDLLYYYIEKDQYSGTPPAVTHQPTLVSPQQLNIVWSDAGSNVLLNTDITLTNGVWANAIALSKMRFLTNQDYEITVTFDNAGTITKEIATGALSAWVYDFNQCQFPDQPVANQFGMDLTELLNHLTLSGNLNNSNVNVQPFNPGGNQPIPLAESIEGIMGANTGVKWSPFRLFNNNQDQITISYSLPAGLNSLNGAQYFEPFITTGGNNFTQKVQVNGTIYDLEGYIEFTNGATGQISPMQVGEMQTPQSITCTGAGFDVMRDFRLLLKDILVEDEYLINDYAARKLDQSPFFFTRVKSRMSPHPTFQSEVFVGSDEIHYLFNEECNTIVSGFDAIGGVDRLVDITGESYDPQDMTQNGTQRFFLEVVYLDQNGGRREGQLEVNTCMFVNICKTCEPGELQDRNQGNPQSNEGCAQAEQEFMDCLQTLADEIAAIYNEDPSDVYNQYLGYFQSNTPHSLCYCADEFCNQVFGIIRHLGSSEFPREEYRDPEAVYNAINPLTICDKEYTYCEDTINYDNLQAMDTVLEDPCVALQISQALFTAQNNFDMYVDSLIEAGLARYTNHCLGELEETMNYIYDDQQNHYTLYYYDQAGNLIKTVPPEGVELLDVTSFSSPLYMQIESDRANHTKSVFTNHRMETRYEYNSLNQLIYQSTPDTDPMDIFELTEPNGLPRKFETSKIEMVTENLGYLAGSEIITDGNQQVIRKRGALFKTENGGKSWKRMSDITAADIHHMDFSAGSGIGLGVGYAGAVFYTESYGSKWELLDTYQQVEMGETFLDVQYISGGSLTPKYALVGENQTYVELTIGAQLNSFTVSPITQGFTNLPTSEDIVDVFVQSSNDIYILVQNKQNGRTSIYKKDNTLQSFVLESNISTDGLTDISAIGSLAYFAGSNGQLYGLDLSSTTPELVNVETGVEGTISDLHFINSNRAIALKGDAQKRVIVSGTQAQGFTELNMPPITGISSSKNGAVSYGFDGTDLYFLPVFASPATINPLIGTPFTAPIQSVWVNNALNFSDTVEMVVFEASKLYYTLNANVSSPIWQSIALAGIGNIVKSKLLMGANNIYGVALNDQGKIYGINIDLDLNTIQTLPISNGFSFNDIEIDLVNNLVFATRKAPSTQLYHIDLSSAVAPSVANLTTGNLAVIASNKDVILESGAQNALLAVGDDNQILTSTIIATPSVGGATVVQVDFTDISTTITPSKLREMDEVDLTFSPTVVGNDGQIFERQVNGSWERRFAGTKSDLWAIDGDYIGGSKGLYAMLDGISSSEFSKVEPTINTSNVPLSIIQPSNTVKDISSNDAVVYVTLSDQNYLFGPKALNQINRISTSGRVFNGISVVSLASNEALGFGDQGKISKVFQTAISDVDNIYYPPLLDIDFKSERNGIVLGEGYFRRVINGGDWQVVRPTSIPLANEPFRKAAVCSDNLFVTVGDENEQITLQGTTTQSLPIASMAGVIGTSVERRGAGASMMVGSTEDLGQLTNSGGVLVYSPITPVASQDPSVNTLTVQQLQELFEQINDFHIFDNQSYFFVTENGVYGYNNAQHVLQFQGQVTSQSSLNAVDFVDRQYGVIVGDEGKYLRPDNQTISVDAFGYLTGVVFIEKHEVYSLPATNNTIDAPDKVNYKTVVFSNYQEGIFGGSYLDISTKDPIDLSANYLFNDPNQRFSSRFYYDRLGRLVVSQNSRQHETENSNDNSKYSYTIYDELGRVTEVGEKTDNAKEYNNSNGFLAVFGSNVHGQYSVQTIDDVKLNSWVNLQIGERNEVTKTFYDNVQSTNPPSFTTSDLTQRKRIAQVAYFDSYNASMPSDWDHATFYGYDIHGNVETLIQDNRKMAFDQSGTPTNVDHNRYKRFDYVYDLISGNVHRMSYQDNQKDQWHHAYKYDADNRITEVFTTDKSPITSLDRPISVLQDELLHNSDWQNDARYLYYDHGPLARVEIGEKSLQGMDYVYTIHGWLKGVNATNLDNHLHDPGKDAGAMPKDVMAFNLSYFTGDYQAISTTANATPFVASRSTAINTGIPSLFNGNIGSMQTSIRDLSDYSQKPMLNSYSYDQLNRLASSTSTTNFSSAGNIFNVGTTNQYANSFTYDANGNILTQQRHNSSGTLIEDLTYRYHLNGQGQMVRNRLYHINDAVSNANLDPSDLEDMGAFTQHSQSDDINQLNNYSYDEEGRLVEDKSEGLIITWRVDGKIAKIVDVNAPNHETIEFDYDAMGNRIAKKVYDNASALVKITYYILDAQGNTIAVYSHENNSGTASYGLHERMIYGSSRLGMQRDTVDVLTSTVLGNSWDTCYIVGNKYYEMSNHLGSVLTVIRDIKNTYSSAGAGATQGYRVAISSVADYSPYGVQLDMRTQSTEDFRFGYQGSENDIEIKDAGNSYTTHFRQLDPRIGRWLTIDPKGSTMPWQSPYNSMDGNPIRYNDPGGDKVKIKKGKDITGKEFRELKKQMKKELRQNSKSFNEMFSALKDDKSVTVFVTINGAKSSTGEDDAGFSATTSPNENGKDIDMVLNLGGLGDPNQQLKTLAHEFGHAYRIFNGDVGSIPKAPKEYTGLPSSSPAVKKYIEEYVQIRVHEELVAVHMENIVVSELKKSGHSQYANLSYTTSYQSMPYLNESLAIGGTTGLKLSEMQYSIGRRTVYTDGGRFNESYYDSNSFSIYNESKRTGFSYQTFEERFKLNKYRKFR